MGKLHKLNVIVLKFKFSSHPVNEGVAFLFNLRVQQLKSIPAKNRKGMKPKPGILLTSLMTIAHAMLPKFLADEFYPDCSHALLVWIIIQVYA